MTDVDETRKKLIALERQLTDAEEEYLRTKREFDSLKAEYTLLNDWEKVLGKKKPTVSEKESFIKKETLGMKKVVDHFEVEKDHYGRLFAIEMALLKAQGLKSQ